MSLEHHHDLDDEEVDLDDPIAFEDSPGRKDKRKRDGTALRKAPQAPKRFKSSYICFFMAKQPEIKEELGDKATVTEISKRSAEMWKSLPTEERQHWDEVAAKDKQRYMVEKAAYTGPWQVPWKRAKKDPSAPKRPMSAFLYYSQGKRSQLKEQNPNLKNTEVSRLLGEMWRNAPEEERRPHIEKEKVEREKYKKAMAKWRKEFEEKQAAQRDAHAQQIASMQQHSESYGDAYGGTAVPGQYLYQGYPYHYPTGPGPYMLPINGKTPVILGPSGTPHYSYAPGQAPAGTAQQATATQQQTHAASAYPSQQGYDDSSGNIPAVEGHFDYSPAEQVGEDTPAED